MKVEYQLTNMKMPERINRVLSIEENPIYVKIIYLAWDREYTLYLPLQSLLFLKIVSLEEDKTNVEKEESTDSVHSYDGPGNYERWA